MAYDFAHGSGTANDPYQIWNQTDLEGIGQENSDGQPNYFGNYFKQMADLSLTDYECNSLVVVNCSYDGGNHKVMGLEDFFFFQQIGGVLKNLVFVSPTISKSDMGFGIGTGIISYAQNYFDDAEIENVAILGASISGEFYVGGLVGQAWKADFCNCFVLGATISGERYVGGFVGLADACSFERCIVHGVADSTDEYSYVGGFVGGLAGTCSLTECGADIDVTGGYYAGGFVGESANSVIENCYALGDVVGKDYVGGFAGVM